ncbi:GNAT family N-acetyltransferase [Lacticaseibacillus absianus]|uniref:GNAT family N-acetyltransferase n=1 Tax=Lacticaseibacillus absianus TaxID=2729623 RepID=UPI0015CDBFAD|nr:GNAT family protein [Lacticaseibacillus absianus]
MTPILRTLTTADMPTLYALAYEGDRTWQQWDGPYFDHATPDRAAFLAHPPIETLDHIAGVIVDDQLIGVVTAYYEDGPLRRWLECGIVLYRSGQWGHGIGSQALRLWAQTLFARIDLPHLSLTTWSGNSRMMHAAVNAGFQLEGQLRQVRFWQGRYWDSMKYGCLRDDCPR